MLLPSGIAPQYADSGQRTVSIFPCKYVNQSNLSDTNHWAILVTIGSKDRDAKEVQSLVEVLLDNGWNERNILQLVEEEATKENICTAPFEWLRENQADPNDVILFFFSMHGDQTDDKAPFDEPDGRDEYLVPFDYNQSDLTTALLDDELADAFGQLDMYHVAIIVESCHSGGMVDGSEDLQQDGRVILMSAAADETSGPLFLFNRWLFPFYTTHGLKGCADSDHDAIVTAEEVFYFARRPTTIHSITIWIALFIHPFVQPHLQHPQLFDGYPTISDNIDELPLLQLG
jgi:hypothetical protein